jgi:hypothetical protein
MLGLMRLIMPALGGLVWIWRPSIVDQIDSTASVIFVGSIFISDSSPVADG